MGINPDDLAAIEERQRIAKSSGQPRLVMFFFDMETVDPDHTAAVLSERLTAIMHTPIIVKKSGG